MGSSEPINLICDILLKLKEFKSLYKCLSSTEQRDVCDILHMMVNDLHTEYCQDHTIKASADCRSYLKQFLTSHMVTENVEDLFNLADTQKNGRNWQSNVVENSSVENQVDKNAHECDNHRDKCLKNSSLALQDPVILDTTNGKYPETKKKMKSFRPKITEMEMGNCFMTHFHLKKKSLMKIDKMNKSKKESTLGQSVDVVDSSMQEFVNYEEKESIQNQAVLSGMENQNMIPSESNTGDMYSKQKIWKFTNYDGPSSKSEKRLTAGVTPCSNSTSAQTTPAKKWVWVDCQPQNYRNVNFSKVYMSVPVESQANDAEEQFQHSKKSVMDKLRDKLMLSSASFTPDIKKQEKKSVFTDGCLNYEEKSEEDRSRNYEQEEVCMHENFLKSQSSKVDQGEITNGKDMVNKPNNEAEKLEHEVVIEENASSSDADCTKDIIDMKRSLTQEISDTLICPLCDVGFDSHTSYKEHMELSHKTFTCPECGVQNLTSRRLKAHYSAYHNHSLPPQHVCKICNDRFETSGKLTNHERKHTGERPFFCETCKETFTTSSALYQHERSQMHRKLVKKPFAGGFKCSQCKKQFDRKYTLKRHVAMHSIKEKKYSCSYCNFKSWQKMNLRRHVSLHFEQDRNFVCEHCGAAFHQKSSLQSHLLCKHNNVRKYSCDTCGLTFKLANNLARHKRVHLQEKVHHCLVCDCSFKRFYNLRRHMKKIHGDDSGLHKVNRVQPLDSKIKSPTSKTDQFALSQKV